MDSAVEKNQKCVKQRSGWTPLLVLTCAATTMGTGMPVGYYLSVINTPAEHIKAWCSMSFETRYGAQLNSFQIDLLWSSIVSMYLIGGICGSLVGGNFCNRFGRKGCMLTSALLLIVAGIFVHFCRPANSVEMLLLGRFIAGVAAAFVLTGLTMYQMEIAPSQLHSTVAVFLSIGLTSGICMGQVFSLQQVFGTEALWQYALSFYTLLVVLCYLPAYWFPESPRWLYLVRQDEQAARLELQRLRGRDAEECISLEIADMKAAATVASAEKTSFMAVVRNPEFLLPLVIVCVFQVSQQLSGINAIFFYSARIFTKGGLSLETAIWINFSAGILQFLIACICPMVMTRFNRRPIMLLSTAGCALGLVGITFTFYYITLASWMPIVCMGFIALFIICFSLGLAPISYFIGSELFEVAPRSVAMSLGSLCSWTSNFMIGMFFPMLEGVISTFAFLPCAVMCLICFLLTWRYLPETRGRDPAELKSLTKDGFRSKVK